MTFLAKINKIIIIIRSTKKKWYHMMFFKIIFTSAKSTLLNMYALLFFPLSD